MFQGCTTTHIFVGPTVHRDDERNRSTVWTLRVLIKRTPQDTGLAWCVSRWMAHQALGSPGAPKHNDNAGVPVVTVAVGNGWMVAANKSGAGRVPLSGLAAGVGLDYAQARC